MDDSHTVMGSEITTIHYGEVRVKVWRLEYTDDDPQSHPKHAGTEFVLEIAGHALDRGVSLKIGQLPDLFFALRAGLSSITDTIDDDLRRELEGVLARLRPAK